MDINSIELRNNIPVLCGNNVIITTPIMTIPFGLEYNYEKYLLKLSFKNYKTNNIMKHFYTQIKELENRLQTLSSTMYYHSNIKISKSYDPLLVLRVDDPEPLKNKLIKGSKVRCKFILQKMWNYKDKSGTFFTLKEIEIE
jgi:hypothetical protein